nr:PREDICTED: interleukin-3 [Equus przewalskii]
MSSLPILHLLLLLFTLHAPQAHGRPSPTLWENLIKEIMKDLNTTPLPPQDNLNPNEIQILGETTLLRPNLDAFCRAVPSFKDRVQIGKNLKELQSYLPTPMPMETDWERSISIKKDSWGDFQKKLIRYLETLENFLRNKH